MKEKEAISKWCPFGRMPKMTFFNSGNDKITALNRDETDSPLTYCYGSNCMAWRKAKGKFYCDKCNDPQKSAMIGKCTCGGKIIMKDEGFCGIAGK